jgi:hypothetical protein
MADQAFDPLFLSFQAALVGRYSLERELGRGGMGVVYLAREVRLDRPVAIKLLPPEFSSDARLRDRFTREARTAARLSHPYIVPIHSVDEIGGFVFYVMAYVDGETLAQRVARRGPIQPDDASRILREVAWALAYAHGQGVVHRDIKPANILLEAGTGRAMVTDFGIARLTQTTGETAVGELLGTPEYMSPEQAGGDPVDGRSDLYSLAVVGFYALTGTLPFESRTAQGMLAQHLTKAAPPVAGVARGVPKSLAAVIDRCLQKDPAARFDRGEALAEALAPSLEKRVDIPIAVRIFLDRRRMAPLVILPAMLVPMAIDLLNVFPGHEWTTARLIRGALMLVVALGAPLAIIRYRLRRLLKRGYGPDDLVAALRFHFDRRREEFLFEHGATPSVRERLFRAAGITGLVVGASSLIVALVGGLSPLSGTSALVPVAVVSLYAGFIGTAVATKWRRLRNNRGSAWAKFWQGKVGRALVRLASLNLGQRTVAADRPTEMAIATSAEALYESLTKDVRQALAGVPEALRGLEGQARAVRARMEELDAALAEARRAPAHSSGARQEALVADLGDARARAEGRLAEVVTALENLRLDLLRLHAGAGTTEGITRDLDAARSLGEGVDRLMAGKGEVEAVLAKR